MIIFFSLFKGCSKGSMWCYIITSSTKCRSDRSYSNAYTTNTSWSSCQNLCYALGIWCKVYWNESIEFIHRTMLFNLVPPPEISYPLLKMVNLLYGIHILPIRYTRNYFMIWYKQWMICNLRFTLYPFVHRG